MKEQEQELTRAADVAAGAAQSRARDAEVVAAHAATQAGPLHALLLFTFSTTIMP